MQAMQTPMNSVVPTGLQELLQSVSALEQVAAQQTPEGQPTVAGLVGQAAQRMVGAGGQPPQGMPPQGGQSGLPGIMPGDPYRQQLMGTLQEKAKAQAEAQAKMMQMMAQGQGPRPPGMAAGGVASLPAHNLARLALAVGGVVGYNGEEDSFVQEDPTEENPGEIPAEGMGALPALSAKQYQELQRQLQELKTQATQPRTPTPQEVAYQEASKAEQERGIASIDAARQRFEGLKEARLSDQKKQEARDLQNYLMRIGAGRRGTLFGNMAEAGLKTEEVRGQRLAEAQKFREQEVAYTDKLEERRGTIESMRLARMRGDAERARIDAERLRTIDTELSKLGINIGTQRAAQLSAAERAQANQEAALQRAQANQEAALQRTREQQRGMDERARLQRESQERIARIRREGVGAEKITDLDKQYKVELEALLASGEPNDAATRKRAMNTAQDRMSRSAATYRAETNARDQADQWVQMQLLTGPRARELRALRTKDPVKYAQELKALQDEADARYQVRSAAPAPTRNPPATGAATPALPPGFVPVTR